MNLLKITLALGLALVAATAFSAQPDVEKIPSCKYCGMDREKFSHSRMYAEYDDSSEAGTCSLRCMAVDLANSIDKAPKTIRVGDYNSRDLIDAETAVWVIGGDKPGVMTARAKWAFAKKEDAEAFVKANKGELATFEDATSASYSDLYKDTKAIRDRRKAKKMKAMEAK